MTRLRVAAGLALPRRRTVYGHGRVWVETLKRLSRHVRLDLVEPRYLPGRVTRLRRPDVWLVNGHAPPPDIDGPAVVVFHEVSWHRAELRAHLVPDFRARHEAAAAACVEIASRVLSPSRSTSADVIEAYGFDQDRIDTVPYGVDPKRFRPGAAGGRRLVAQARGGDPAPYVLFVASLLPRKNLVSLREAMASLARRGFPHVLALVSGGSPDGADGPALERAATAELPGAPGRIVRIGFPLAERRLVALMAGADAFCLPSFYEGFGLSVLEAMACGAPVITSTCGSLPEVVGDAGLAVDPTPEAIEQALLRVLSDPVDAERLRRAARARAERLTWDATVEGWVRSLRLAVEQGAAPATSTPPAGGHTPAPEAPFARLA